MTSLSLGTRTLALCLILLSAACASDGTATAKLEARAKVSRADAEKTAIAKVPGSTVSGGGIEEENGKLLWSFDLATPGSKGTTEVEVDAVTGAVISADQEGSAPSSVAANEPAGDTDGEKAGGEEKEEPVALAQVPAAARSAAKAYASDSEIKRVVKDDVDGTPGFEFEIERGGRKLDVTLTATGKLLGTEEVVPLSSAPAPVQKTLGNEAALGKVISVEKVIEGGKTTYEAVVEKNGKRTEVTVGLDGSLLPGEDGK